MNKIRKELESFSKDRCERSKARHENGIYDALHELIVEVLKHHKKPRKSQRKRMEKLARKAHEL